MPKYITLLRGINVGGNNLIRMADLKACFEAMGLTDVRTYIQSGNVLFDSPEKDVSNLTDKVEKALSEVFKYKSRMALRSYQEMQKIVESAPKGFGTRPGEYRYDVIFLKPPLSAAEAMRSISVKEGVDEVFEGPDVLYFSRLISRAAQSRLNRIVGTPSYQNMTIRNWNTTTKLLALMEQQAV